MQAFRKGISTRSSSFADQKTGTSQLNTHRKLQFPIKLSDRKYRKKKKWGSWNRLVANWKKEKKTEIGGDEQNRGDERARRIRGDSNRGENGKWDKPVIGVNGLKINCQITLKKDCVKRKNRVKLFQLTVQSKFSLLAVEALIQNSTILKQHSERSKIGDKKLL